MCISIICINLYLSTYLSNVHAYKCMCMYPYFACTNAYVFIHVCIYKECVCMLVYELFVVFVCVAMCMCMQCGRHLRMT